MNKLRTIVPIALWMLCVGSSGDTALPTAEELVERYRAGQAWQDLFSLTVQRLPPKPARAALGAQDELFDPGVTILSQGPENRRWKSILPGREAFLLTRFDKKPVFFETLAWGDVVAYSSAPHVRSRVTLDHVAGPVFGMYADGVKDWLECISSFEGARVYEEPIDGVSCFVLEVATPRGSVKASLDPNKRYALVRYLCSLDAGKHALSDRFTGEDTNFRATIAGTGELARVITSKRSELVRSSFEKVDGFFVPAGLEVHTTYECEDGSERTTIVAYTVTNVDLSPNVTAETFLPDFPDGTKISRDDATGRPEIGPAWLYEWRNGEIAQTSNLQKVNTSELAEATFRDELSTRLGYAVLVLLAAVCLLLLFKARRMLSNI